MFHISPIQSTYPSASSVINTTRIKEIRYDTEMYKNNKAELIDKKSKNTYCKWPL